MTTGITTKGKFATTHNGKSTTIRVQLPIPTLMNTVKESAEINMSENHGNMTIWQFELKVLFILY